MTCFLKPARTTEKEKLAFHVIPAEAGGEEGIYGRRFKRQEPLCTAPENIDSI
jgi:hypothetical protein